MVSILSDISVARSKALDIIKKSHSHSMNIIENIKTLQSKHLNFYSDEDIVQLNDLYNYAAESIPTEYMVFKDIKTFIVHVPSETLVLSTEGAVKYEIGDPHLKEVKYTMNLVVSRQLFSKLFNIPSFLEIIENFINSLDDNHNISNIMQTNFWKTKISNIKKER